MNVTIRQLKLDEWAVLRDVRLEALQTDPQSFGSHYAKEIEYDEEKWRSWLDNPHEAIFLLSSDDTPIGMTGIYVDADDPTGKNAILWGSWIHPDYRGNGLSNMLYEARLQWAHTHSTIEVIKVNHRAHNVASKFANQKHGFVFTHSVSKTWQDGITEDDVCYELRCKPSQSPWGIFPIETERLILRPPTPSDLDALLEAKRETWQQLQQWMHWAKGDAPDAEADRAMLEERPKEFLSGADCMLFGFDKEANKMVAFTGLHRPDWENRIFETGYWVRTSEQGKGYAQEVTQAMCAHAFNQLNASKVIIAHAIGNDASEYIIKKLGFSYTHTVPPEEDQMGQESLYYEMLKP